MLTVCSLLIQIKVLRERLASEIKIEKERRKRVEEKVRLFMIYELFRSCCQCAWVKPKKSINIIDITMFRKVLYSLSQCRNAETEVRRMQLSAEEIKSTLSHKVETRNKSIVELENVVNELRMKNIQQNNKVSTLEWKVLM